MAIKAVDAPGAVRAEFVFVHHRVLLLQMALGTLARRADQRRRRLLGFDARARAIDEKSCDDQPEGENHRDEDRPERHGLL